MSARRLLRLAARGVRPGILLLVWVYLYLVFILGAWVVLAGSVTGWKPVTVTSGSMAPALRPGDVLLLDRPGDELLAQGAVITFERDGSGELVTHRISAVEDGRYVTRGDANSSVDAQPVDPSAVQGVGRLVVPMVGLPFVWADSGDWTAFGAWCVVTIGALGVGLAGTGRWRKRGERARGAPAAQTAIRRVRGLVGVIILSQFVVDSTRFAIDIGPLGRTGILLVALGVLGVTNLVSMYGSRLADSGRTSLVPLIELLLDTALVLMLTTVTGAGGVGWVLYALPIVEAAVRFRLSGALAHWMLLTAVTLGTRIWVIEQTNPGTNRLINELEQVVDQFSVLLIVVIPGAFLAEQLAIDVLAQRRATKEAIDRGQLLQHVVELGREVNRIGSEVFETLAGSVLRLGFAGSDVVVSFDGGPWQVLATAGDVSLPAPGAPASGLRPEDVATAVVVDADDEEYGALAGHGLGALVRVDVGELSSLRVAIRAATPPGAAAEGAMADALRLLASQASVALHNDQLVTRLREMRDELEHQATHDALTGLPNRLQLLRSLESAVADESVEIAVLFLDLNGFKPVNDRLGHDAGDELLRAVAGRLAGIVEPPDLVARLGGDEFTLLVREPRGSGRADAMAAAVHRAVTEPYRIGRETVAVSTSVGIARSVELGERTGAELLRRADVAMYHAKSAGGTERTAAYRDEMDAEERRRARMSADIVRATQDGSLWLAYQPMVTATGTMVGVEALLRWQHPELGPIGPLDTIELATVHGVIDQLNEWVIRRAAQDAASWVDAANDRFFVTVNVSPGELASPRLPIHLQDALIATGLPASTLMIELSERIVAGAHLENDANLQRIAELGVELLLDDFGEGQTSLGHLRGLPIAGIKLDRSLVVNSVISDTDRIILASVTRLAHELGLFVVAEGIETPDHHRAVVAAGCDLLQGYLTCKPVTAATILGMLRSQHGAGTTADALGPAEATAPGSPATVSSPFASIAGHLGAGGS